MPSTGTILASIGVVVCLFGMLYYRELFLEQRHRGALYRASYERLRDLKHVGPPVTSPAGRPTTEDRTR